MPVSNSGKPHTAEVGAGRQREAVMQLGAPADRGGR